MRAFFECKCGSIFELGELESITDGIYFVSVCPHCGGRDFLIITEEVIKC